MEYFVKEFDGIIYPWNKESSDYKYIYMSIYLKVVNMSRLSIVLIRRRGVF